MLGMNQIPDSSNIDLIPETGRCVYYALEMLKMATGANDLTQSDLWKFVNQAILDYDWRRDRRIYGSENLP